METEQAMGIPQADFQLECTDLASAQQWYEREMGFRLEMIYPADDPRVALLSGYGIYVQLQNIRDAVEASQAPKKIRIEQAVNHNWGEGRAGMQYRDLIPDRVGGKYIASHIRIQNGGPVPDYVHHHHIRFQLIYCYKGWVRVLYEDQGPAMVMHAGDCFLQPPHIRHRVLESSDNMEVIELACPAEHETFVEHNLTLPTDHINHERDFGGQQFVFHVAKESSWQSSDQNGFSSRDTGIHAATNGIASALVFRAGDASSSPRITVTTELHFIFVLTGSATLNCEDHPQQALHPGDSFVSPINSKYAFKDVSTDFEFLRVTSNG